MTPLMSGRVPSVARTPVSAINKRMPRSRTQLPRRTRYVGADPPDPAEPPEQDPGQEQAAGVAQPQVEDAEIDVGDEDAKDDASGVDCDVRLAGRTLELAELLCDLSQLASPPGDAEDVRALDHEVRRRLVDDARAVDGRDQDAVPTGQIKLGERLADADAVEDADAFLGR